MDVNKTTLLGRVTQDAELKQTSSGVYVLSTCLVTNKIRTDENGIKKEKAEFHNLVLWKKTAEIYNKYVVKGQKLYIEGELQTRSWEAQDGSKRYKTEIRVTTLIMLEKPKDSQEKEVKNGGSENKSKKKERNDEITAEDIPF